MIDVELDTPGELAFEVGGVVSTRVVALGRARRGLDVAGLVGGDGVEL